MAPNDSGEPRLSEGQTTDITPGKLGQGGGVAPVEKPAKNAGIARRPTAPDGDFPKRTMRWYQLTSGEVRNIGVFQAASAVLAAIGTFALQSYLDLAKDLALLEAAKQDAPDYLHTVSNFAWYAWVITWTLSLAAFIYQLAEIDRIKVEHGELPLWRRVWNVFRRQG